MTSRSRKVGKANFAEPVNREVVKLEPEKSKSLMSDGVVTTRAYRGKARSQTSTFDFSDFSQYPLIFGHQQLLFNALLHKRSIASLIRYKKLFRWISKYLDWLALNENLVPASARDMPLEVTHTVHIFLKGQKSKYEKCKSLRAFLRAIGVPEESLPPNIYDSSTSKPRQTNSTIETKSLLDHFKAEADVIRQRLIEGKSYVGKGNDPRLNFGGKIGDWERPENRMYVIENVIKLPLHRETYYRENGLRNAVGGLQRFPGAVCLRVDGVHRRVTGIAGHLAWFYPSQRDYLPFVILLLARTSFPFSTIAGLRIGGYHFRPVSIDVGIAKDRVLRFSAPKYRTVNDTKVEPDMISCVTITNSKSHVFSLIKFLEELTKPLRAEIDRQIIEISSSTNSSQDDKDYLQHLIYIRNDLMIYTVGPKIYSLGASAEVGSSPSEYSRALALLNFPTDLSRLKSTNLAQGFLSFGERNLLITLLGNHRGSNTAKPYRDRFALYEVMDRRFIELFDHSMALIKDGAFEKETLRVVLSEQGLTAEQIKTLLSNSMRTSWGNGCCDPLNPPNEFDDRMDKSKLCVSQRCIDGCSNARWFSDALKVVRSKIVQLNKKIDTLPLAAMGNSIIHHRIKRLLIIEKEIVNRRAP